MTDEPLQFKESKQICPQCGLEIPDFEHLDVHARNPWLSKDEVEVRAVGIRKASALFRNAEARGRIKKR